MSIIVNKNSIEFLNISLLDFEKQHLEKDYKELKELLALPKENLKKAHHRLIDSLWLHIDRELKRIYRSLDNWQVTQIARHSNRPYALDYINLIFDQDSFEEMHGDRNFRDDPSIVTGMASLEENSVVVVAQQKGRDTKENMKRNFGMPNPEGYRKALRIFQFAEKFQKPIITFVDTPGAFPGKEGEERSQGEAIARNIKEMMQLSVPIITVVIGEGGSGGALAIAIGNHIMMLENSIYSVISPESCASILWRDANAKDTAAKALKNDAKMALKLKVIDEVVSEGIGGAHRNWELTSKNIKASLLEAFDKLKNKKGNQLIQERLEKFAQMGVYQNLKP